MATSTTLVRPLLAVVAAASLGLTGCLEPGPKYHGKDHKFSWQEDEQEGRKTANREDLIYVQPPRADYGSRK
ncbi:hypothetical protein Pla163_24880 [Planctomycetes bacterium Pla163]|uniref:Uncharacterized protein n=1 Tax=Rohdeia mirabilis TaxID=2528008 RepID=A0A518D1L8_9BACT|nr:hypothetical protein Pla163_24880 [Planctomycetes bacterium Pla163]